jgi:hypothetical protein
MGQEGMDMKKQTMVLFVMMLIALSCVTSCVTAGAASNRTLPLDSIHIEDIDIHEGVRTWTLTKVCIDGQAYLLLGIINGPSGISPSFKDGKPEQCQVKQPN